MVEAGNFAGSVGGFLRAAPDLGPPIFPSTLCRTKSTTLGQRGLGVDQPWPGNGQCSLEIGQRFGPTSAKVRPKLVPPRPPTHFCVPERHREAPCPPLPPECGPLGEARNGKHLVTLVSQRSAHQLRHRSTKQPLVLNTLAIFAKAHRDARLSRSHSTGACLPAACGLEVGSFFRWSVGEGARYCQRECLHFQKVLAFRILCAVTETDPAASRSQWRALPST